MYLSIYLLLEFLRIGADHNAEVGLTIFPSIYLPIYLSIYLSLYLSIQLLRSCSQNSGGLGQIMLLEQGWTSSLTTTRPQLTTGEGAQDTLGGGGHCRWTLYEARVTTDKKAQDTLGGEGHCRRTLYKATVNHRCRGKGHLRRRRTLQLSGHCMRPKLPQLM